GSNGSAYSDLPDVQTFWETNASRAAAGRAVLTDYAGGDRGRDLLSRSVQHQVSDSLIDLDVVFPGAQAAARVESGQYVAHREHWPSNPLARGGYTCYTPGQFTGLAGLEGEQAGPLKFAGEHADSFYDWQGFMEGACLSGARAAGEILADIRARRL
ncbi:MAG: FAD-dependent oxidoreductase, partial [Phycisphaerales bacterium]|nr:FAD-dependent oxidoreductase [Phycisphaerales bacterium]